MKYFREKKENKYSAKMKVLKYLSILILLLTANLCFAQNNFSIKAYGLGVHPFSEVNSSILTKKIDANGKLAFEPGLIIASEFFINSNSVSLKPMQSIYLDRMGKLAGFTHLGFRAYVYNKKRHTLALGIGPSLFYRQNWSEIDNYINEDIYNEFDSFQYKFFMLSGEIEYSYYFSKLNYLSFSINQIDLQGFTFSVGVKQLFKYKKKKHSARKKACDCPSFR